MTIIVVGCDCTGKTTLIDRISKKFGIEVLRGSSFELTANKTNEELYNTFMNLTTVRNVIFDRFMYCNYVYAPLYEDYSRLTKYQIGLIESQMVNDTVVIHLTADKETIMERFNTRGEEYVTEDKIQTILDSYDEILKDSKLKVIKFNTTELSVDDIMEKLMWN